MNMKIREIIKEIIKLVMKKIMKEVKRYLKYDDYHLKGDDCYLDNRD